MKGRRILYSAREIAWLEANRGMVISDYHRAFTAAFDRADVTAGHLHALRKRRGWKTGRTGQFEKGGEPANKGKRCAPGKGGNHPNARRTQFKSGGVPHTYRGAGHERIDGKDGYVVMIIDEQNPWTGAPTRPVLKHRYLWEQANGPLPDGYCLKCLDGDKANTDLSNWEAIPRAMLPRLNGGRHKTRVAYDEAPDELKPAVMAVAKLEHGLRQRRRSR